MSAARTTASGTKKQKLAWLAAIADCARIDYTRSTDVLAERLCSHAAAGNLAGVRGALVVGADVDKGVLVRDEKAVPDGTALHFATFCGHEACVRELIKEGANVNYANSLGATPLFYACSKDNDAIITALLDANADPLIVNNEGNTAASYGDGLQLVPRIDRAKRMKSLLEQPRVPVPWSREGHASFPKPRREQAMALVRTGAILCLATPNPSAFRNAWKECMMETYLPAEIPPLSRVV